ncbi:MAG: ABC transporter permease [Candidatus Methanomethylicia archaeon]
MAFGLKYSFKETILNAEGVILIAALVGLIFYFAMQNPAFLTVRNFIIILETMSILAIASLGICILLIAGEIDISITAIMELAATIAALMSINRYDTGINLLITFLIILLIGTINGFLTAYIRIPSFIVTLATKLCITGIVLVLTKYSSLPIMDKNIIYIFYNAKLFGISISFYWLLALAIIIAILLRYFRLGRWIYMTGGNETYAWALGIPTRKVKFIVFVFSAVLAGISGLIMGSRSVSARAFMADGYLLPAIAAPILGGGSMTGGLGSTIRTLLGALLLTIITNGVYIMGLEPALYNVFMGITLVIALSIRASHGKVMLAPWLKIFKK